MTKNVIETAARVCIERVDPCGNVECSHGFSPPQDCPNDDCSMRIGYELHDRIMALRSAIEPTDNACPKCKAPFFVAENGCACCGHK